MKLKLTLALLVSLAGFSSAATTVTVTNFTFADGLGGLVITDSVGGTLSSFSLAVGAYGGAFAQNGSSKQIDIAANTNTFNTSITDALAPAGSGIVGQNVAVAIGDNPTDFGASTNVIVFVTSGVWGAEDPVLGGTSSGLLDLRSATLVPGTGALTTATNTGVGVPFNGLTQGVTFVPEPSAALLGAFGLLGLLRRRRA